MVSLCLKFTYFSSQYKNQQEISFPIPVQSSSYYLVAFSQFQFALTIKTEAKAMDISLSNICYTYTTNDMFQLIAKHARI